MMISSGVISIDDGGSSTCVITRTQQESFPSVKGLYGKRTLTETNGKYDFIVEYKGEKYVMGTLAKYDCLYPLQMHTDSKQNLFFDLSILVSIHQYGYLNNYIVTSVPIAMHNDEEKQGRIERLIGEHVITVNGKTKKFNIIDVKVAPETAVAFWIEERNGKNRFIDLGSRTIGYATTVHEEGVTRFIDSESGTFKGKGLEALDDNYDQNSLADYICGRLLSKWSQEDDVYLLGGGALDDSLVSKICRYFPNTVVLNNPKMANALGMYYLGCVVYDME
ncbi:ParM/StbA family protein [Halobacillus rhizosphaerae]|uniref:ParM/StbA family protein n=1 Tax=Halobacillus rhizosphaerae TaxID=3064889 RepID=UPI00398A8E15